MFGCLYGLQFSDIFRINKKINSEKDNADILTLWIYQIVKRSFGELHPNLSMEWDIEKTTGLLPFNLGRLVTKKYIGDVGITILG